jgi:hypothetical protein
MYYSKFRITNFKGIKDTTVHLAERSKLGVFAFVGLNESGKTTILEAIHSFSPDPATSRLLGGGSGTGVPISQRVPRHMISSFSGAVAVVATVNLEEGDWDSIAEDLAEEHGIKVDPDSVPEKIVFNRSQHFSNGDYTKSTFTLDNALLIKTGRQRKWREPTLDELEWIRDAIYNYTPDIAFFPTFVFDFPKRIFLTLGRGDRVSNFYRSAFQDILDFDGKGLTIKDSVVSRVRSEENTTPWIDFLRRWNISDDKHKVQHVMDRASATVTDVVFGRWNEIFSEDPGNKEIVISYDTVEGEERDASGNITKTHKHDVYITFQIRDGTRRFNINDRSLGFRWFFSFMLFTQFRVARENSRPMMFLFDEPASNLHAAAQQKLIESFPEIASGSHTLLYTTHSHYMIEPKWLEQTFIVTNRNDAPPESVIDAASLDDESLDIKAERYRSFVNANPSKTHYFQPVLDRLQFVPSKFDIDRPCIVFEGKSDYYIMRYTAILSGKKDAPILPGLGASTLGALVSLQIGWGLRMFFIFDDDREGNLQAQKYIDEYGLNPERVATLGDLLDEIEKIEDLIDDEAKDIISSKLQLSKRPNKKEICRYFQESLARNSVSSLGDGFDERAKHILNSALGLIER